MTLPPPQEWRNGTPEQQSAYQGFRDARRGREDETLWWKDENGAKCGKIYADYFEAGQTFRRLDKVKL